MNTKYMICNVLSTLYFKPQLNTILSCLPTYSHSWETTTIMITNVSVIILFPCNYSVSCAFKTTQQLTEVCSHSTYANAFPRVEQDNLDFLDLVHFDFLVTHLVSKILIRNVLFLSPFQDLYFLNLDLVLFQSIHLKIFIFLILVNISNFRT